MIKIIVATDPNGLIGIGNAMPWNYPADFKRFKEVTMNGVIVMGSKTWESIPGTLPGRKKIVISKNRDAAALCSGKKNPPTDFYVSNNIDNAFFSAVEVNSSNGDIWVGGGTSVYEQTMDLVDIIDLTLVPEVDVSGKEDLKYFPKISEDKFQLTSEVVNAEDNRLIHKIYTRK